MNTLDDKAIPAEYWWLIKRFNSELDKLEHVICDVCNKIDFDMGIKKHHDLNECKRCRAERGKSASGYILKFSKGNDMDPGAVLSYFFSLSIAEKMLIARAHVHMNFRWVKGCQYKYSGHIVNFMQNTAKIINCLPSLPKKLQVVILKPSSSSVNDSVVHQGFAKTFWVQRKNVEMWLHFLVNNYPDYKHIVIDKKRISLLPGNDTMINDFSTILYDEVNVDEHDDNVAEKTMTNEATTNEAMTNKATNNEATINETTINETTINETTIDEATVEKATINETTVSEATTANESSVNEATTTNKAKNDAGMCDERIKKKENTPIQEINQLGTLNLTLKLDCH